MEGQDQESEARILAAARSVFARNGMSGARMQEIADAAGVNKALLHYYFRTKEKLALAVFSSAVGELLPRIFGILASESPLEQKVREVVEVELEFLSEHPYLPGYVASELHYHPELAVRVFGERRVPLERLGAQLDEAAAAGAIRPIGAEQFVANLMALLLFPFIARPVLGHLMGLEGERFDGFIEERKTALADFFLGGLRP